MFEKFQEWCTKNDIMVYKNDEMFFVSNRLVIMPDCRLLNRIFIDLIRPDEITDNYLAGCEEFGKSHGTLIVIPFDVVMDLDSVTKADFESKFNITM